MHFGRVIGINNLQKSSREAFLIPVPPLHEQTRIVARVQELMAVLDRLEDQTNKTEEKRNRALIAATQAISQAADTEEITSSWLRLANNLDSLVDCAEDVKTIRAMVLELAVRGKLVSQDPHDEPASFLLERIKREKARLVKEGKIKAGKELLEIKEEERPFELPKGWALVRLGELVTKLSSGSTPLGGKQVYQKTGPLFLRSQNVWENGLKLKDVAHLSEQAHFERENTHVHPKDLLFNITGASIGRCALVPDIFEEANVSQHVVIVRPALSEIRKYLHTVLTSDLIQKRVQAVQVGVSREGLSVNRFQQFLIPLAPLSEQFRIDARLQELMVILDRLEERLTAKSKTAVLASESLVKMNQA